MQTQKTKAEEARRKDWEGQHKSKIISSWGAYSRKIEDGLGGEILVYEKTDHTNSFLEKEYNDSYTIRGGKYIIYYRVYQNQMDEFH